MPAAPVGGEDAGGMTAASRAGERSAAAYRAAVARSAPALWWPLDGLGALVGPDLSLGVPTPTFGVTDPWGEPGAVHFDESQWLYEATTHQNWPLGSNSPWSTECWFRSSTHPGGIVTYAQFPERPLSGGAFTTFFYLDGGGTLVSHGGGAWNPLPTSPGRYDDGQWHHAVITWSGQLVGASDQMTSVLYVDGVAVDTRVQPGWPQWIAGAGQGWQLGVTGNSARGGFYTGDLCHVACYGRALSADEVAAHYSATVPIEPPIEPEPPKPPPKPPPEPCRRRAWLTLGGAELDLEDLEDGYACSELDLGWPEIREVVTNRPDADGVDDRTRLMGARVITAHIVAWGARQSMDDIARRFGPYVVPSVRPELHYTFDTPGDEYAERMIRLRASAFSSPVAGASSRSITIGWTAPDPILWDPVEQQAITRPTVTGLRYGRLYNLRFDRTYPAGSGGSAVNAIFYVVGDVMVFPRVRIVGPIVAPALQVINSPVDGGLVATWFYFENSFRLDPDQWVEIDSARHTVTLQNGSNVLNRVRWMQMGTNEESIWPSILSRPLTRPGSNGQMNLWGSDANWNTQAIAYWNPGYLS